MLELFSRERVAAELGARSEVDSDLGRRTISEDSAHLLSKVLISKTTRRWSVRVSCSGQFGWRTRAQMLQSHSPITSTYQVVPYSSKLELRHRSGRLRCIVCCFLSRLGVLGPWKRVNCRRVYGLLRRICWLLGTRDLCPGALLPISVSSVWGLSVAKIYVDRDTHA